MGPENKRLRTVWTFHCTDDDEKLIIRNIIHDFYTRKIIPTCPKLLTAIHEQLDFPWKLWTLQRLLHKMGYKWKKSTNIRKILVEKPNIVAWCDKYLTAIDSYRNQGRNIIYLDETWVDNTLSFSKCWQNDEEMGILKNNSSFHRYIIVHAGGEGGFVKDAALIFKARSTTGDYHGQMNALNFEKWINEKLLPNIVPIQ